MSKLNYEEFNKLINDSLGWFDCNSLFLVTYQGHRVVYNIHRNYLLYESESDREEVMKYADRIRLNDEIEGEKLRIVHSEKFFKAHDEMQEHSP
jgi:hypothetical protein